MKWGHFDRVNSTFKMLLFYWNFDTVFKKIRSYDAENLDSVAQKAAKLPAIKLWEWFDPGDCFEWGWGQAADFFLRPPTLTAGNFEALWPTDPKFLALKDLNLLKEYIKYQETSYNSRLGFAQSNRPHLHRAYLVTVRRLVKATVYACHFLRKKSTN